MNVLLHLKTIDIESIDQDDAVIALALCKMVKSEYEACSIPLPEWISNQVEALTREIAARRRDYLKSRLRKAQLVKDGLKTRDERLTDVTNEIAALEKELGAVQ